MRKSPLLHPILFGIYPVIFLYAQMPGGVTGKDVIQMLFIQGAIIMGLLMLLGAAYRDRYRAAFTTSFIVFYFSSTGYIYRALPPAMFHPFTHLGLVALGWLAVLLLHHKLMWTKYLPPERRFAIAPYLNLVAALSLLYPAYRIGIVLADAANDTNPPWQEVVQRENPPQSLVSTDSPDIYYIILDGYSRADVLQNIYGFDNREFIDALRERGFYVAEESRSNYIRTVVSLSSSLNMGYINFAEKQAGWRSVNYLPLFDLIRRAQAQTLLSEAGYSIIAVDSDFPFTDWRDADVYLSPYNVRLPEFERVFLGTTAVGSVYDTGLPLMGGLRAWLPLAAYETRRTKIQFAFNQMETIAGIGSPKFAFIHIIAPHPPFVFDRNGSALVTGRPFANLDGENYRGSRDEYLTFYVEQIQFVNSETLRAIDAILANAATPPVIIIQGDHGGGSQLDPRSLEASCLYERVSILNAYYMPDGKTDWLYPSITPVNSFRVVFNTYFGTDYPLLPDRTYYSPHINPYQFVEITGRIESTCSE